MTHPDRYNESEGMAAASFFAMICFAFIISCGPNGTKDMSDAIDRERRVSYVREFEPDIYPPQKVIDTALNVVCYTEQSKLSCVVIDSAILRRNLVKP